MGKKSFKQKQTFCGLEKGLKSPDNVLHCIDLGYVPPHEKKIVKDYCLKRAEDAGSSEGFKFLNDT